MKRIAAISIVLITGISVLKAQYNFVGDAADIGENCYRITAASEFQNGAIWYDQSIDLNTPFHLQYEAGFGNNPNGADGMVFVMQQVGNNVLGEAGGGMGFSGFSPSFGVEFDTWQNLDFDDPPFDHMAFLVNGNVIHSNPGNIAGPVQISAANPNVSDGVDHVVDIFWEPETNTFTVWFDCQERLSATIDLADEVFMGDAEVFWGFTAATGGSVNEHTVCLDPSILGLEPTYEICQGESATLQTTGNSAGTYAWTPEDFLSDPTSNAPEATPEATQTYTVTFSDLCGTEQTQTTTVVVSEAELDLGPDIDVCIGEPLTIIPLSASGTITWEDGSTDATLIVEESGVYSATATDGACTATDEISVTFTENPELNLPEAAEICEGEAYTADLSDSGLNITWDDDPDAGAVRPLTEAGTYTATGGADACEASATITLTVNPLPVFDLGPGGEFCDSETVVLSAAPGAETTWNTGAESQSITVTESGFYEAVSESNGCTYSDQTEIILLPAPNPEISGETAFCTGESTVLTATGGVNFVWSNGAEGSSSTVSSGGNISVTATDEDSGCPGTATAVINLLSPPFISTDAELTKCENEEIVLSPDVRGADYTRWNTGDSLRTLAVSEPGVYTVTAGNHCGERSTDIAVIDDECLQFLFAPNAFTPNGDGRNDLYRVYGDGIDRFNMQIFDRWGNKVFETDNIREGWNGSYQNSGYYCEAGMYTVRFELEYEDMDVEIRSGHVTLLR